MKFQDLSTEDQNCYKAEIIAGLSSQFPRIKTLHELQFHLKIEAEFNIEELVSSNGTGCLAHLKSFNYAPNRSN